VQMQVGNSNAMALPFWQVRLAECAGVLCRVVRAQRHGVAAVCLLPFAQKRTRASMRALHAQRRNAGGSAARNVRHVV